MMIDFVVLMVFGMDFVVEFVESPKSKQGH